MLAKQPADLRTLETALYWAREIAEERGDVVVLYCIDMAIAEVKMKGPPTAMITNLEAPSNQEFHEKT
jgi:hypothetical protein